MKNLRYLYYIAKYLREISFDIKTFVIYKMGYNLYEDFLKESRKNESRLPFDLEVEV